MIGKDIPKKIVLVLLFITIIMSVLGTWIVLDATSTPKQEIESQTQSNAVITILPPENAPKLLAAEDGN